MPELTAFDFPSEGGLEWVKIKVSEQKALIGVNVW